jgi:Phage tail lysozyme
MAVFPKESNQTNAGYYYNNLLQIAMFMMNQGYSRAAAAGMAGTIAGESSGNPESVGSGGAGLIGWTPPSSASPYSPIVTGNDQQDFDNQLEDILTYADENSQEAVARGGVDLSTFKNLTNPNQAATDWSAFEGPLNPGSDIRSNVVNEVYNALGSYKAGDPYPNPSDIAQPQPLQDEPTPQQALNAPQTLINEIESGLTSGLESALKSVAKTAGSAFLGTFGISSWKDFFIRAGLILVGAIIVFIGIKQFANLSMPSMPEHNEESESNERATVTGSETRSAPAHAKQSPSANRESAPHSGSAKHPSASVKSGNGARRLETGAGQTTKSFAKDAAKLAVTM